MNIPALYHRFSPVFFAYRLPILLGCIGIIFFAYGLIQLFGSTTAEKDVEIFTEVKAAETKPLVVDVEGGVVNPGVYTLNSDARIQDALVAAGGLSATADRNWVAKTLNLAAKVTDGAKIYIPMEGEIGTTGSISSNSSGSSEGSSTVSGLININSASQAKLEALPGIGPVTAQKVIDGRPYSTVEELLAKKILSKKVYEQVKEKVSTY